MLLRDRGGEHSEDLVEVNTPGLVQITRVPHAGGGHSLNRSLGLNVHMSRLTGSHFARGYLGELRAQLSPIAINSPIIV